jgi:hypothetical protein
MRTFHIDLWLWERIIMDHVLSGAMVASTSQMSAIYRLSQIKNYAVWVASDGTRPDQVSSKSVSVFKFEMGELHSDNTQTVLLV